MPPVAIVPFPPTVPEAARLIDADAKPLASVSDPEDAMEPEAFREAVFDAAFEHDRGAVAGILFAERWGGGGIMIT